MHSLLVLLAFVDFWPESSDEFIAKTQPVAKPQRVQVVFLTAGWCAACEQFKRSEVPLLLGKGWSVDGRESSLIRVVDVDESPELASRFNARSLPCFVRLVDGKETRRLAGYQPAGEITDLFYDRAAQLPVITTQVAEQVQQPAAQQVQQQQQQQWSLVPIRRRRFLFWQWSE